MNKGFNLKYSSKKEDCHSFQNLFSYQWNIPLKEKKVGLKITLPKPTNSVPQ